MVSCTRSLESSEYSCAAQFDGLPNDAQSDSSLVDDIQTASIRLRFQYFPSVDRMACLEFVLRQIDKTLI